MKKIEREKLQLIPNDESLSYAPGSVLELTIMSPFPAGTVAQGWLVVQCEGIVLSRRFTTDGKSDSHIEKVKIEESWIPNATVSMKKAHPSSCSVLPLTLSICVAQVSVELLGPMPRLDEKGVVDSKQPPRPAVAVGSIDISIPPKPKTLNVAITPLQSNELPRPGAKIHIGVEVLTAAPVAADAKADNKEAKKDSAQVPVEGAELTLIVVDDSVLSLTGHQLTNPLSIFYPKRTVRSHVCFPTSASAAHVGRCVGGC
jgi:hypothetical protein